MQIKITLPQRIEVDDYHEFTDVQTYLKLLSKDLKVKELGCNGRYVGIIYSGKLTDKENKILINEIKVELDREA